MSENFITDIYVENSINIKDFNISLAKDHCQHLIITGKNGSGKTSLLLEINKFLSQLESPISQTVVAAFDRIENIENRLKDSNLTQTEKENLNRLLGLQKIQIKNSGGTRLFFSNSIRELYSTIKKGEFLLAFFDSKRHTDLSIPKGINKIELKKKYKLKEKANTNFIQYIVNLKADRSFARDDNEIEVVQEIDNWFIRLEERLKLIFDVDSLELRFNRKSYNFDIFINDSQSFNFNTLSDGYSAIISIVTELILRMEAHNRKSYDLEGIVIIDEIETHLHVDLQKKILPFLTDFFPKIQFIVTTHSPFVLSSLSNTTICDLETRMVTTDLSGYSYDALLESYFKTDKYSEEIKSKIIEFDKLTSLKEKTAEQLEQIRNLRNYFAHTPKYLATELLVKLQQIELNELNDKK